VSKWAGRAAEFGQEVKPLAPRGGIQIPKLHGPKKNGLPLLDATTVFDDSAVDELLGGNGKDWFLLNLAGGLLDIADLANNETTTDI
jgi:hypothetical protein